MGLFRLSQTCKSQAMYQQKMATYRRLQRYLCRTLRGCSKNNLRVWRKMWTEASTKMWGSVQNCQGTNPFASPNSNYRKNCLQGLPWNIRPWVHTKRSQGNWFYRLLIISIKQSLCDICTYIFKRTPNFYLK